LRLQLSSFKAITHPEICQVYLEGHMQVLKDYNIIQITSYNNSWVSNPDAYIIIAKLESTNEIVGGIRIEMANEIYPLPIERAIGGMDSGIYGMVKEYAKSGGVGELCGLWNSKAVKGVGVSVFLTRAAISIINQIKFKTLLGICAEYTLKMFTNVGFSIDKSLGKNGEFPYPDERYITRTLGILNVEILATAHPYDRERILGLRENPKQLRIETGSKDDIEVEYDLIINNINDIPAITTIKDHQT
jgi:hypothetical protein